MAKLSEKHPRESEIAKKLLEPYIHYHWGKRSRSPYDTVITLTQQRADDLEMKICEALVESFQRGHYVLCRP